MPVGAIADVTLIVYNNNINQNIVGTGYLQYDIGPDNIDLIIRDSGGAAINTIPLVPGTSVAFTYRRFSTIEVVLPLAAAGTYQGEFCITTRYAVT